MSKCECGSYAINPNLFPRTGEYLKLCDVCYFKKRLEEAEQRLAAAEAKNIELERELFIFASDVIYFENDKMPDWVFEKAKAIYGRLCLGKGE